MVDDEQVADMLDFGQSDKWYDEATAAVRAAERENEAIMEGDAREPEIYEYHLQHWRVHVTEIQKPGFYNLPKDVQERLKDHVLGHEMHMMTISKKNPTYLERLQVLPQFPLFFTPDHLAPKPVHEPVLDPKMDAGAVEADVKAQQIQGMADKMAMAHADNSLSNIPIDRDWET